MTDKIAEKSTTWYTVKVQANRERSVAEKLKLEIEREGYKNLKRAIVPLEKVYYVKEGKKMSRDRVIYPGYAFIEVDSLGEIPYILRQIGGNSGLLKDRAGNPIPIQQSEIVRMMGQIEEKAHVDHNQFMVNETVKVIGGAFTGFRATIEEIQPDRNKVRLAVSIFGRFTYLDLEMDQIDKLDE